MTGAPSLARFCFCAKGGIAQTSTSRSQLSTNKRQKRPQTDLTDSIHRSSVRLKNLVPKARKNHLLHIHASRQLRPRLPHRNLHSLLNRISINSAADRRKRQRPQLMLPRQREAPSITTRQQLRLAALSPAPHRPHRVNHKLRRQPITLRDLRPSRLASAQRAALGQAAPPPPPDESPHPRRRRPANSHWPHSQSRPLPAS